MAAMRQLSACQGRASSLRHIDLRENPNKSEALISGQWILGPCDSFDFDPLNRRKQRERRPTRRRSRSSLCFLRYLLFKSGLENVPHQFGSFLQILRKEDES